MVKNSGRVTLKEVNQKVEDLKISFYDFKNNEFNHLRQKVDKLFWLIIMALLGILSNLLARFL